MANLRNRKSFSSPSLQALAPPPIPTGKGSRSAADPAFSEYIDNTTQVPELILPEHIRRSEPADIDYQSLMQGDDDTVNRLMRSASDLGVFQISGHGISCEELKTSLVENQWVFDELIQTSLHYPDRQELVWCHDEIAEKAENVFGDKNLHIFSQNVNKVARKLEEIAEELAPIIVKGATMQWKKRTQTNESTLVLHRYLQTTAITDLLPSTPTNEGGQIISSEYDLSLHLLLGPGEFFSQAEGVDLSFFTRRDVVMVTVRDNFERAGEFKNAIGNLKFEPLLEDYGPLFSIELKWSSSDMSAFDLINSAQKFSLADQILILLFVAFLYKTCSFLIQ